MTRVATAVVGAGYGDEGKGAWVDRLSEEGGVVVRHNGGAQAGHTVVAPDGRRHVFHHVGAGSFRGASTFLASRFVSNPVALLEELDDLEALGVRPIIAADPRGTVTTPYDMVVNRVVELRRGASRHGSCGLGVGETVERDEAGLGITVADLRDGPRLAPRLRRIRDAWVPARLARLGVHEVPPEYRAILEGEGAIDGFLEASAAFLDRVEVRGAASLLRAAPSVVFEGAQGLLLDQDRGAFPFVTRSHTGIRNVVEVCREAGVDRLSAVYATRCYRTRHGAGPLPGELGGPVFPGLVDDTNAPNAWQGTIRHAVLDADVLAASVEADLRDAGSADVAVEAALAVSCLDQAVGPVPLDLWGARVSVASRDVGRVLAGRLSASHASVAYGAARDAWSRDGRPHRLAA